MKIESDFNDYIKLLINESTYLMVVYSILSSCWIHRLQLIIIYLYIINIVNTIRVVLLR
jgi:hypothetical protein